MASPSALLNYKLIKKVKDEKFDVDALHHYSLLIQLGVRDMQVGIVDSRDRQFLLLEDYIFGDLQSNEELLKAIQELFEAHALLQAGFWKDVSFSIKNNKFVQVPASLFLAEAAAEYLSFNATVNPETEDVAHCQVGPDIVTVFAIYRDLKAWISSIYPHANVHFVHHSASLIQGILSAPSHHSHEPLYVYVDRFKMHIAYKQAGKLVYYNQFVIKHFSDYVKYIMLVLGSLHLDQTKSQVVIWGYIGRNSPHSQEFAKYIKNVTFGSRPESMKFGYLFDEVQDHHFYDLYNMYFLAAS